MLALVTADVAAPHDPDLVPLHVALSERRGSDSVAVVSWDDPSVDWSQFDAVVIRSTWDYVDRLDEFVDWVGRVGRASRLVNSADAVTWSSNKEYLLELAGEGVPIVPTTLVRPGERVPVLDGVHVVKPTVGAGSKGARRCEADAVAEHVAFLHSGGRTAMIQPYLDLLDQRGEIEHCFVPAVGPSDGIGVHRLELSHAFRKGALLTADAIEQFDRAFVKEDITPIVPTPDTLRLAHSVLDTAAIGRLGELAYARVDVAPFRDVDGVETSVVMEVELIEPSFYFDLSSRSVDLFADRLLGRLIAGDAPVPAKRNG